VMGIDAGRDDVAADFFAGLEDDAGGAAVPVENFCDGGVSANFDAQFACGGGDRVGIAPVPPRLKPHERNAPSISPM